MLVAEPLVGHNLEPELLVEPLVGHNLEPELVAEPLPPLLAVLVLLFAQHLAAFEKL